METVEIVEVCVRENQFREWVRRRWQGWISSYEPRRGSSIGIADIQIVVDGAIYPVELKVGTVDGDLLYTHEIRPAQIQWHRSLREAGGRSFFLVGESAVANKSTPDRVFIFDGIEAEAYLKPIKLKDAATLDVKGFDAALNDAIRTMTK